MDLRVCLISFIVSLYITDTVKCEEGSKSVRSFSPGQTSGDVAASSINIVDELFDYRAILNGDGDKILIWIIEDGKPVGINTTDYTTFESGRNYIILQGNPKVITEYWNLFYWVGEESSLKDRCGAAFNAVLLDSKIHSTVNIHREIQRRESQDFKEIFSQVQSGNSGMIKIEPKAKRMFSLMVTEAGDIDVNEVALSKDYIEETDICLVLLMEAVIYVYCGNATLEKQQWAAKNLAKILQRKKGIAMEEFTVKRSDIPWHRAPSTETRPLKRFYRELRQMPTQISRQMIIENPDEFKPAELRKIRGEDYELRGELPQYDIKLKRVYVNYYGMGEEPIKNIPPLKDLNSGDCYLIDSRNSDAGLFVWMGEKSQIEKRQEAGRRIERYLIYLRNELWRTTAPITYIDPKDVSPGVNDLKGLIHIFRRQD